MLSLPLLCSQSSDSVGLCPVAWGARGPGVTLVPLLALPAWSRSRGQLPDAIQLTTLPFSWSRSFHAVACLLYGRDVTQLCSRFFTGNIKAEYLAEGLVTSRGYSKEFRILDFCYSLHSIHTKLNSSFSCYLTLNCLVVGVTPLIY